MAEPTGGEPSDDDPFDRWVLDDEFVKGAFRTEASAQERVERMRRLDADLRRMPDPAKGGRAHAPAGVGRLSRLRARVPRWWWAVALLLVAVVAVELYERRDDDQAAEPDTYTSEVFVIDGRVTDRPSPPADVSPEPLGTPPAAPAAGGAHGFVQMQPDGGGPVAYDPCRPIHIVVNDLAAPPGAEGILEEAVAEVSAATGLQIVVEGPTTEPVSSSRRPVQKARYGDRWAPVLVAWSDPSSLDVLAGDTAGVGGSQAFGFDGSNLVYVTGTVVLDAPQLAEILERDRGRAIVVGIVMHELGHVVGLDHVDDPTQLMAPESSDVSTFQAGDRTGLARLGAGDCFADL